MDDARTGQVLGGRYRLIDLIGSGGMATVWRAEDRVLGRTVAVKVLTARHLGDRASRERIRQEARTVAALSHPNIAQVHDYGEAEFPFVVMELVPGGTLLQRVQQGPLSAETAMRLCGEVASALAAAHAEGLVHRDIKPANIMLAPTGAKVVDFGIAALVAPGRPKTEDFEIFGTPTYLAPERLIDDAVEPASDVYALGVLLYRLLSGRSPWTAEGATQMLTAHIYLEPAPLPEVPGVPDYVTELCNRCLRKDPTERPSAREVAALLSRATAVADPVPAAPVPTSPVPASPPRRVRRWAIAAALLAVAAPATFLLLPGDDEPTAAQADRPPAASPSGPVAPAPAASPAASSAVAAVPSTTPGATQRAGQPVIAPTEVVTTVITKPGAGPAPVTAAPTTGAATTAPTTPPPATTPAEPVERTFTSQAGSVRATCAAASTAQILSWSAVKPYKMASADKGPASAPSVTFKHGSSRVVMTVVCDGGVPRAG